MPNDGNIIGIENCIAVIGSTVISETTKRTYCTSKLSKQLETWEIHLLDGFGRPEFSGPSKIFKATLSTRTRDVVVTGVDISFSVGEGTDKQEISTGVGVWLESGVKSEVEFNLDGLSDPAWEALERCLNAGDKKNKCFAWDVTTLTGVDIGL